MSSQYISEVHHSTSKIHAGKLFFDISIVSFSLSVKIFITSFAIIDTPFFNDCFFVKFQLDDIKPPFQ